MKITQLSADTLRRMIARFLACAVLLTAAIPLVRAGGGEVHFMNGSQLPLRQFDLRMGRIIYVAGSPVTCARLMELMR